MIRICEPERDITHNATFGIEFESNAVDKSGQILEFMDSRDTPAHGFGVQADGTTMVEINSPVFSSIVEASKAISQVFKWWANTHRGMFFSYNRNRHINICLTSSGQHIHVGTINNGLSFEQKQAIVYNTRWIYPMLGAISAQPLPSERMLSSGYCAPLTNSREGLPREDEDHHQEVNYSDLGTVEFRIFDTNIPQCSLAEAWMLQKIVDFVRKTGLIVGKKWNGTRYMKLRSAMCNYGYTQLPIGNMLCEAYRVMDATSIDNFEVDSVKEMYYLMAKYRLNASDIYHIAKPNRYEYFYTMFTRPESYLQNYIDMQSVPENLKTVFKTMKQECDAVQTFDDILTIANTIKPSISINDTNTATNFDADLAVRQVRNKDYSICRIAEVGYPDVIAEKLADLINTHGHNGSAYTTGEKLMNSNTRYYLYTLTQNDCKYIIGAIGYRMSYGLIEELVVHSGFRNLGIANILLDGVIGLAKESCAPILKTYIETTNSVGIEMFKKRGFKSNTKLVTFDGNVEYTFVNSEVV